MTWQETYRDKLTSPEEAAKTIQSGDVIFCTGSASIPYPIIEALVARAQELENVKVISTLLLGQTPLVTDTGIQGHIDHETLFYGGFDKIGTKNKNSHVNSIQFSKMAWTLKNIYKVNVLMVEGTPPDADGYIGLGSTGVCWNGEIAEYAEKIIIGINEKQVPVNGVKTKIHVSQVDCLCESHHPLSELPQPEVSEIDQAIAALLLDHIPDGACIQIGVGGLANAVGYGLEKKKDLSVRTEMLTDSMVHLAKMGVINGKILAAFGLGSTACYEYCANPQVELRPISEIADANKIGEHDNFIAINSCLMADLTGQVCAESIGSTQFSAVGGQLDFVRGAAKSKGGKAFMCMPSTFVDKQGNTQSKVYFNLPPGSVVTTPRTDVMYIVTEYGVADLYCRSIEERVEAMIAVAHPDFREGLREQAVKAGMLRR